MRLEEVGAYILLLCHVWEEKGIVNELRVVKACLNHDSRSKKIWENIQHCFYIKNGQIFHKRLDEERRKQRKWREKSRLGGKKSAEARRKKSQSKGGSHLVQPKGNTSFSSSSSSTTKKKKKTIKKRKTFTEEELQRFKEEFKTLWKAWPKEGRFLHDFCLKKFIALCKKGKLEEFKKVTNGYLQFLQYKADHENFPQRAMHLKTWLNNWEGEKEQYENFKYEPRL